MTLEEDIEGIKKGVDSLNKHQLKIYRGIHTACDNQKNLYHHQLGLYIITAIAMIAGIKSCKRSGDIKKYLQQNLQIQNVIGNDPNESFYEINNQRAFLEIDGMPVEDYIRTQNP